MIVRILASLMLLTFLSGCSTLHNIFGEKEVEIITKPVRIEIIQPTLPRPIELENPKWYVVSEAIIANPCKATIPFEPKKFDEDGKVVFVAMTVGDYKMMSKNTQELRRYIRELGEVIVYYRNVTIHDEVEE